MATRLRIDNYKVEVNGNDISKIVTTIDIYSDLQGQFMTCNVSLIDINDIYNDYGILIGEEVKITLNDGDYNKSYDFIIASPTSSYLNNETFIYVIELVSKDMIKLLDNHVTLSNKDKITTAIRKVFKECTESNINIIDCSNDAELIVPNYNGIKAINTLCKFALSSQGADYLFFQSDTNTFNLKPLSHLKTENTGARYTLKLKNKKASVEDAYSIEDYRIEPKQSLLTAQYFGGLGSTTVSTELGNNNKTISKREIKNNQFNLNDEIKVSKFNLNTHFKDTFDKPNIYNSIDKTANSRLDALNTLENGKIVIKCTGDIEVFKKLGKTAFFDINTLKKSRLKGDYLITAVRQHISINEYYNLIEGVKL